MLPSRRVAVEAIVSVYHPQGLLPSRLLDLSDASPARRAAVEAVDSYYHFQGSLPLRQVFVRYLRGLLPSRLVALWADCRRGWLPSGLSAVEAGELRPPMLAGQSSSL